MYPGTNELPCVLAPPGVDAESAIWLPPLAEGLGWEAGTFTTSLPHSSSSPVVVVGSVIPQTLKALDRSHRGPRVLVLMEPFATAPFSWKGSTLARFDVVFAASRHWADKLNCRHFVWPQTLGDDINPICPTAPEARRDFDAVLVAANKRSAAPSSLYSLRRRTLREALRSGLGIAVVGNGWDSPRWKSAAAATRAVGVSFARPSRVSLIEAYGQLGPLRQGALGAIENKRAAYSLGRWALVMENSADYVSEKLVDAIVADSPPVYVGPDPRDFGFPPEVAVHVQPTTGPKEIVDILLSLSDASLNETRAAGRAWVMSQAAQQMDYRRVFWNLGRTISNSL